LEQALRKIKRLTRIAFTCVACSHCFTPISSHRCRTRQPLAKKYATAHFSSNGLSGQNINMLILLEEIAGMNRANNGARGQRRPRACTDKFRSGSMYPTNGPFP